VNALLRTVLCCGAAALFFSCASIFRNPDIVHNSPLLYAARHRCDLPPLSLKEERIYWERGDSGLSRIPEHDFYWMQFNFLDVLLSYHLPGLPPLAEETFPGQKNITRYLNGRGPDIDPSIFLKSVAERGFAVYAMDVCPARCAAVYVKSGLPLLLYGTMFYKKRYAPVDTVSETPECVIRKLETFDVLYGYQLLMGPSQHLPGEGGDEYLLELRGRTNLKSYADNDLINRAVTLYGGAPIGSNFLVEKVYVVLPADKTPAAYEPVLSENAAKLGYAGPLPAWVKVEE